MDAAQQFSQSVEAMVRHVVDTYGGLDITVNNAGIGGASSQAEGRSVARRPKAAA